LSVCQGLINAFDMPARQVFLAEIVERKEDLANAIALNSSMFNGARLVGPAIAGALIAEVGVGWCFVVDSASYVAVIAALLAMRIERRAAVATHVPLLRGLTDGLSYCMSFKPIRALLLLSATLSFVAIPYSVLLPTFAIDVLHGNEATLGFLTSANGLGALIGALYLASRSSVLGLGRLIGAATIVFGIGLLGFAFSHSLLLSLVALLIGGVGMMIQMAAANTILQTIADQDKRGRVMSLYSMAVLGVSPFGSLLGGFLADWTSPAATVALGGFGCLISAALFFRALPELRAHIRPVYRRMGILPMPDPTDPSLEVPTPS
ncbi:MAG TPA: MFS transporter, partial [Pirellulales bacterium]|nr:MFS transporter [Pirellulales bacterium]